MKPSLRYTYCTLLLVFLVSSCTLFIIVASETLKPTADDYSQHLHHHNQHKHQEQHHGARTMPHPARIPDGSVTDNVGARQRAGSDPTRDGSAEYAGKPNHNSLADGVIREKGQSGQQVESHSGEPQNKRPNVRPLKRPSPGGKITSKKDILTEKPSPQPEEPPDLKDVIFLDTISKNVGVTNSGLQDIPGPPSVITLVDNQHRELNNIESKLEENLEATLKNLSHNNVLNVPTAGISNKNGTIEADDSGAEVQPSAIPEEHEQPSLVMVPMDDGKQTTHGQGPTGGDSSSNTAELKPLEVNLTEENPMPVFSEWAQKQMAEAEKKLGEVVNASAMKKGTKPAGSKTGGPMKLRAKNYAAPECGAKIIASNPEAQSTGSVLTAPKDEYLLNPCTSKIWFVVELCEPVQAERIELANFELFSSSPKEFSVSVSNRFPTRDWANVGQFTAKDERDVQSFMLHPHLFGKFVRVEILSHYNQEHFCPVSLFRVYGTSEFEAFETDNTPLQPDDDDDEEDEAMAPLVDTLVTELGTGGPVDGNGKKAGGKHPNNILKSAGEVVMNMVKKAAEALGKTGNDSNDLSNGTAEGGGSDLSFARGTVLQPGAPPTATSSSSTSLSSPSTTMSCVTLAYTIRCVNCTDRFRARLESTVNCKHNLLTSLLGIARIGRSFDSAQHFLCANVLGFNLPRFNTDLTGEGEPAVCLNMRYSVLNLLPDELVAGLCNVVAYNLKLIPANSGTAPDTKGDGVGGSQGEEQHAHRELPVGEKEIAERDIPPQHSNDNGRQMGQQEQQDQREEIPSEGQIVDADDSNHHHQHWETIEETEGIPIGGGIGAPSGAGGSMVGTGSNNGHGTTSTTQKVQPESVFLRLSNRIKALERNMSLSGQYLEELSRRYRKQVEELQHSYAKTLHEIEEQNRKMRESETSLREVNEQLRHDLFEFQQMVVDWRNVVLAVLGVVVVLLLTLILFVRSVLASSGRRGGTVVGVSTQRPAPLPQSVIDRELAQVGSDARPIRGRMLRRKSIDGMPVAGGNVSGVGAGDGSVSCVSSSSGVIIATAEPTAGGSSMSPARLRIKRPSEEALNISGTYVNLLIDDGGEGVKEARPVGPVTVERKKSKQKHRKVSAPSMMVTVGNVATSTPSTNVIVSGAQRYELPKRSTSMVEPQEQRFRLVNGTGSSDGGARASQTPDHSNRIDELPYLEDNDEFIIPTASDLSYDEFMPGSTASSGAIAALREELVDGGGSRLTNGSETAEDVSPLPTDSANNSVVQQTKKSSSRRLSSPAFFKTSLLRSSLGSKRRSSKKGSSNGDINAPGGGSSSSSSNTSSNSSNSSNISGSSSAGQHSTVANGAPMAGAGDGDGDSKDGWYRWWSENRKQGPSPSTASSSQQDASTFSSTSSSSKQQARRERLKAKSESPPAVTAGGSLIEEQASPVKLSVSFNGDLPTNGEGGSNGGLERKTTGGSRGSIRRLFRKVF
ncbi:AGAP008473-PA-like protein [Anopheles sinensis]|uniref:AGAP008473-PA-like protein n=1 Tax=Anopheles sinensis TaxID=74873 RepID=A0A084VL36_ANOSI|nr:AGAP008473-PA-like protein [Anopheles sinensis]